MFSYLSQPNVMLNQCMQTGSNRKTTNTHDIDICITELNLSKGK